MSSGSFLVAFLLSINAVAQTWEPYFALPDLYPSLAIAVPNLTGEAIDADHSHDLGDLNGLLGITVKLPKAKVPVQLTLTCTGGLRLFDPATIVVNVPNANESYTIAPVIPFDVGKLASIRQAQPMYVNYAVTIGGEVQPPRTERVLVQPINVCPFGVVNDDGTYTSLDFMFAAYVNEDHPQVERILQEALQKKYVEAFNGYQGEPMDVFKQVAAIWRVLHDRGIKYSNIATTVADSDLVLSQHVRLIDESLANTQANCVDGAVLLASVLRKIGIEPVLITIPGHMFVGFDLDPVGAEQAYLETTLLGAKSGTFEVQDDELAQTLLTNVPAGPARTALDRFVAAVQTGNHTYLEYQTAIEVEQDGYTTMHVADARKVGILPILYVGK